MVDRVQEANNQRMDMEQDLDSKGAAVKFPPPLIAILIILLGYGLDLLQPLPVTASTYLFASGCTVIFIALSIVAIAAISFFRAKTHLEPWKPTSTVISSGIFSISRNPIYVGLCLGTLGAGFVLNSWWIVICVILQIWLLYFFVIRLEEAYLSRKFGKEYKNYQQRVRRWL